MPTLARILEACDAVAAAIAAAWGPTAPDEVLREYAPDVGLTPDQPESLIAGRKVYAFPSEYAAPEMLDRDALVRRYTVSVVAVERYGDARTPPRDWLDERVLFFEQKVFNVLRDPELVLSGTLVPDPDTPGVVDAVFDVDALIQYKSFWSQGTFVFQEASEFNA